MNHQNKTQCATNRNVNASYLRKVSSMSLKKAFVLVTALSISSFVRPVSSAHASALMTVESREAIRVLTEQVGNPKSLIRSAILQGSGSAQAVAMSIRLALKVPQNEALKLDAGQIEALKALLGDDSNQSMAKSFIAQGLKKMDAALAHTSEQTLVAYNAALAKEFSNLTASNTGSVANSATSKEATLTSSVSTLQQLALVDRIMTNLNTVVDQCTGGACTITFQRNELSEIKSALSSSVFGAMIQNDAACMGKWKTPNALNSVAEGALALSAVLKNLQARGLSASTVEQAEAAFLDGAAQSVIDLKIASNKDKAYETVCAAFNSAPCNLLKPASVCLTKVAKN